MQQIHEPGIIHAMLLASDTHNKDNLVRKQIMSHISSMHIKHFKTKTKTKTSLRKRGFHLGKHILYLCVGDFLPYFQMYARLHSDY